MLPLSDCSYCGAPLFYTSFYEQDWCFCRFCLSYQSPDSIWHEAPHAQSKTWEGEELYNPREITSLELSIIMEYMWQEVTSLPDNVLESFILTSFIQGIPINKIAKELNIGRRRVTKILKNAGHTIHRGRPRSSKIYAQGPDFHY